MKQFFFENNKILNLHHRQPLLVISLHKISRIWEVNIITIFFVVMRQYQRPKNQVYYYLGSNFTTFLCFKGLFLPFQKVHFFIEFSQFHSSNLIHSIDSIEFITSNLFYSFSKTWINLSVKSLNSIQ